MHDLVILRVRPMHWMAMMMAADAYGWHERPLAGLHGHALAEEASDKGLLGFRKASEYPNRSRSMAKKRAYEAKR